MDVPEALQSAFPALLLDERIGGDGEFSVFRGHRRDEGGPILAVSAVQDPPAPESVGRLEREFALREELALPWSAPPLEFLRQGGKAALLLDDPGGMPLSTLLHARRLTVAEGLRLGAGLAAALSQLHARGLLHKDLKPEHVLADLPAGVVALTGFGLAAHRSRERLAAHPPETLAGTLAYMAPEQTGRMNRGVDARSDLYALGVVLYEALTGRLPFETADPLELIHCHLARKPAPPAEKDPAIPALLSDLVLKLLAKTPEDRFQTARGVEADLRRCAAAWDADGRLDPFPLAEHDVPDRLPMPEVLYGREQELRRLMEAWETAASGGGPALALVSGYSGVGKSALVEELQRALFPSHGLFAGGKFDQYKRDIPYATLAQAFQTLLRRILIQPEEEVVPWRRILTEALYPNGKVLAEIVPELEVLLGRQPEVPDLAPVEAKNRFRAVVNRFLGAFAKQEHPLALFLDDLQWLDPATLELLEHLLADPSLRHLLLMGSYRENEVGAGHPLSRTLESIRKSGAAITHVVLAPLPLHDMVTMVSDLLRSPRERMEPLALLVQGKTGGNPFFALHFLANLFEEGMLAFSPDEGRWTWDPERIAAKGYTDNVVDFMARKLTRLSGNAQEVMKALAVLGMRADFDLIVRAVGASRREVHASLAEAESAGLLASAGDSHAFVHDRIREAAYSLIAPMARPAEHLRMGRLLLAGRSEEEIGEDVFELAGQFNQAIALLGEPEERERVRRLDFRAGRRAKAAIAYDAARSYLDLAGALLPSDAWQRYYEEAFATFFELAECEYLAGNFERASGLFDELLRRAQSPVDRAAVHRLRINMLQVSGKYGEAVDVGLEALREYGMTFPDSEEGIPSERKALRSAIQAYMGSHTISDLASAHEVPDPRATAVLGLITDIVATAYIARPDYYPLIVLKGLDFIFAHGNAAGSYAIFSQYASLLAGLWGDFPSAVAFSELAVNLNERDRNAKLKPMVLAISGGVVSWRVRPFRETRPVLEEAFAAAFDVGEYVYAGHISMMAGWLPVEEGATLDQARTELKRFEVAIARTRNEVSLQILRQYRQFLACLEGKTAIPTSFEDVAYKEADALAVFGKTGYIPGIAFYRTLKQIAAFLFGQFEEALDHAQEARKLVGDMLFIPLHAAQWFFHALTLAALHAGAEPERRAELAARLEEFLPRLKRWAEGCPENFLGRYLLILAEKARIEGRDLEAMRLYEQAIASARENGFVHLESVACERAAGFYLEQDLFRNANSHLRDARAGFLRWGALAKVAQLDRLHPGIEKPIASGPTATFGAPFAQLELPNVVKASQAVSCEIELDKLVETVLRLVLDQAGADRGLLLVPWEEGFLVAAEAVAGPEGFHVLLPRAPLASGQISEAVFRYVERTRQKVLLDDAVSRGDLFAEDGYLTGHKVRSLLCLPLLKQARILGVLYLENRLAAGAFTPNRVASLEVLASQAAIALENARLFMDLEREKSRLQAVIRQVPAGLIIAEAPSGRFLLKNDQVDDILHHAYYPSVSIEEYAHYIGFRPDGRRINPEDWPLARSIRTGETVTGEEIEMLWPDGAQAWLSVSSTPIRDASGTITSGVVMFQDITERKKREVALKASEERFSKAFKNNPTPMAVLRSKDWTFVDANERFLRLLGYPVEELHGHYAMELGTWFMDLLGEAGKRLTEGRQFRDEEVSAAAKDGEPKALLASFETMVLDGDTCYLATFVDLTEHKQVEEQLRQSQKMEAIGSLAGGVAHDFNNLLTVIKGYSEMAMMGMDAANPIYENLKAILNSGERAEGLTRQLLAFSRKGTVQTQVQSLNALVEGMEGMLRRLIEENVEIKTSLNPEAGPVNVDKSQVVQILMNLAVNARDAMPKGGRLLLETRQTWLDRPNRNTVLAAPPGAYAALSVKDTGIGMTPEVKAKIFEPFFTTKTVGKGTGLGLSVVYGLVKQLGGGIDLQSEPGRGTTVCIYFPQGKEGKIAKTAESPWGERPESYRGSGNVLVVEDEDSVRTFIKQALLAQGYTVLECRNGVEALRVIKQAGQPLDLVVTDLIMPYMGGRELAKEARLYRPSLPVLYTSGYSKDIGGFQEALASAEYFLSKPFGPFDLSRKVREILEHAQQRTG